MFLSLLCAAGFAAAQQGAIEEEIRKQAAEISRLMRESERLLLEITRVDRLVETQKQVEEELKKLLPPEQDGGAAGGEENAQKRQQLEQKHQELKQRLEEMLSGEREKADLTVQQLEELLKRLPRQQQQQGGGQGDPKQEEREKRLRDREEQEQKQHQPQGEQQQPRDPKDKQPRTDKRPPPPPDPAAARLRRVEAWIARLPPEDQAKINRNDFSRIPSRYRKLVEEYTAQRAKRAAEQDSDSGR
jgi:hypothetical protein